MYRACSFFTNLDLFCIDNARVIYRKIWYLVRRPWSAVLPLLMTRSEIRITWPVARQTACKQSSLSELLKPYFDKLTMKFPINFAPKALYICLVVVWSVTPCVFRPGCTVQQCTWCISNNRDTLSSPLHRAFCSLFKQHTNKCTYIVFNNLKFTLKHLKRSYIFRSYDHPQGAYFVPN